MCVYITSKMSPNINFRRCAFVIVLDHYTVTWVIHLNKVTFHFLRVHHGTPIQTACMPGMTATTHEQHRCPIQDVYINYKNNNADLDYCVMLTHSK